MTSSNDEKEHEQQQQQQPKQQEHEKDMDAGHETENGKEMEKRKEGKEDDFRDKGWAWMIVLGAFIVNFLVVGTAVKSFGILYVEFQEKYGTSSGATVSIVALTQSFCLILGPLANMLAVKFTSRKTLIVGGFMMCFGFILSMFPTQLIYMYFTYGVLIGTGASLAYSPSIVMVGHYFRKRRALANGLSVAGSGLGNFAVPPFIRHLVDHYGSVSNALLILGALMLHICFAGALLRPLPVSADHHRRSQGHGQGQGAETNNDRDAEDSKRSTTHELALADDDDAVGRKRRKIWTKMTSNDCRKLLDLTLFQNVVFLLYAISVMFMFCGYPTLYVIMPDQAKIIGVPKKDAAFLVSILGITDLVGRISFGFFADLNLVQKRFVFAGCTAASGLAICIMPWMTTFVGLAVLCAWAGLFAGGFFALIAVMLAEKLGVHRLHSAFGLVAMFMGFSFLFGAPISGVLKDSTGNWKASLLFSGISMIFGSSLLLLDPLAVKYEEKKLKLMTN